LADLLVPILHVGYALVPLGFILVGRAVLWPDAIAPSAALHAWTAGAIGTMTIAVMTQVSLGHVGQPLHATPGIAAVYVCVLGAALARIAAVTGVAPDACFISSPLAGSPPLPDSLSCSARCLHGLGRDGRRATAPPRLGRKTTERGTG